MARTITRLALGKGVFGVNCYLINTDQGFVLIDTGMRRHRAKLLEGLQALGCQPGTLRLILITHGDVDHIGSAAYLRKAFDAPIAMHEGDVEMSRSGDMFAGRKPPSWPVRAIASLLFHQPKEDRFEPDVLVDEATDLTKYGLSGAQVLRLRGHSAGSIALLLDDGNLFCGDVLENRKSPALGSLMDDLPAARASVERLGTMKVGTVHPGHGMPFELSELAAARG